MPVRSRLDQYAFQLLTFSPLSSSLNYLLLLFFFNATATTEIYTLSLHDALPIWWPSPSSSSARRPIRLVLPGLEPIPSRATRPAASDRKSTRLNSSHVKISY